MRITSAIYIVSFALTTSATEGTIGYNELFGRDPNSCIQISTGPSDTVSDPSKTFIGTHSSTTAPSSTAPAPAPAAPTPPFATGTCSLHMTQWDSFDDEFGGHDGENDGKYGCEVRIFDNAGSSHTIGWQVHTDCSTDAPLSVNSKLENPMVVTPEAKGDYVQFTVGSVSFKSTDSSCSTGDWDGSDDPEVSDRAFGTGPSLTVMVSNSIDRWTAPGNVAGMEANARTDHVSAEGLQ